MTHSIENIHENNKESYMETFQEYDLDTMELADWANGEMFGCRWSPENVSFSVEGLRLTIAQDEKGELTGGEWRTRESFGFGKYEVSMKPIKNTGVVSSFFTYTGPSDGTQWDEIDIEFLGYDTTKVQFNYFINGVGNHEYLYDLGFDASEAFHTYGFEWRNDFITWFVDGEPVHTVTEDIPSTQSKIMMNVWPGTGVDEWLGPYDGAIPLVAEYQQISYSP